MTLIEVLPEVVSAVIVSLVFVLYRFTWVLQLRIEKEETRYWRDRYEESERFTFDLTKAILCRSEGKETSNGTRLDS